MSYNNGSGGLSELRRIIRMYYPEPPPNTINVLADFPRQPIHKWCVICEDDAVLEVGGEWRCSLHRIPGRSTP